MPIEPIDEQERERIRHALKRFKELNDAGDPYVCKQIKEQTGLPVRLSTLQRFLKGKHRTDDVAVYRCRKFLQMVAPPAAEDELGKALQNFLPVQRTNKGAHEAMVGVYATRTRPYVGVPGGLGDNLLAWHPTRDGAASSCTQKWSTIRLNAGADPFFLRATEHVFDPEWQTKLKVRFAFGFGNTGIFVPMGRAEYLMMVRSFLDARVYLLRKVADAPLTLRGIVYQSAGALNPNCFPYQSAHEIEMTKDAPSAESDKQSA